MTPKETRAVTLPSGACAEISPGNGKTLRKAARMAGGGDDPMAVSYGLIALLAKVDGKDLTIEDVDAMDLEDVLALQGEVTGKKRSSPPSTSSDSE